MCARVVEDGREIIFPTFKFQESGHSKAMLERGNVHISNIAVFRQGNFGGTIDDRQEGQVSLFYPYCKGDSYDLYHHQHNIDTENSFIHCSSGSFFSETLTWALSENKQSCSLITDPKAVAKLIEKNINGLTLIDAKKCTYPLMGRNIGFAMVFHSFRNFIASNRSMAGWVKPFEYYDQDEFRMLWKSDPEIIGHKDYINEDIDEVKDFVIPISYNGIKELKHGYRPKTIFTNVFLKNRHNPVNFSFGYPAEVMSPVIHKIDGKYMLGFISPSNQFENGIMCSDIPICVTKFGLIVHNFILEDVSMT